MTQEQNQNDKLSLRERIDDVMETHGFGGFISENDLIKIIQAVVELLGMAEEGLRFYANPDNWKAQQWVNFHTDEPVARARSEAILFDQGNKAKQTLKSISLERKE